MSKENFSNIVELSQITKPIFLSEKEKGNLKVLVKGSNFELSKDLPCNKLCKIAEDKPAEIFKDYNAIMPEYWDDKHQTKPEMYDYLKPNIGWKLHLNIRPENIKTVSDYLVVEGYCHKYLHGGEIDNGKIFTIYIGSYKLAIKYSQKISQDLLGYLCKPVDKRETEFAAGVAARFCADRTKFAQYGSIGGLPYTKEDFQKVLTIANHQRFSHNYNERQSMIDKNKMQRIHAESSENSYHQLNKIYGKYFFE